MELTKNPFFTLDATMRDGRRRIHELAEEKGLTLEESAVREASGMLTNPRKRVEAEIGWLPGIGPRRAAEALTVLLSKPLSVLELSQVPPLAHTNLLADGLVEAAVGLDPEDVAEWVIKLAANHEQVFADETAALLNEDRQVAGFPAISDLAEVESALQDRRRYYCQAVVGALDKLPTKSLITAVTVAVDDATEYGTTEAPILIDDLVDAFEVRAQGFLEAERQNIAVLIERVRDAAGAGEAEEEINEGLALLEKVVTKWDAVAQPIQVSSRSRGLAHEASQELAAELRSLAVELTNEYHLIDVSQTLNSLLQRTFAEVDKVVEQSEADAVALDDLAQQRARFVAEMKTRAEAWKEEITYEADVGAMFKEKLRISPDGVEWRGRQIPLEEITMVRWGGTSHSVSGVPTGTKFTVRVKGGDAVVLIDLRRQDVYLRFVERLWKTAGVRLLTEMLEGLREGKEYTFGSVVVSDGGIVLEQRRVFGANKRIPCRWGELVIGQRPGAFFIGKRNDAKVGMELGYQEIDNVHILEAAMRMFWKTPGTRMSELLENPE